MTRNDIHGLLDLAKASPRVSACQGAAATMLVDALSCRVVRSTYPVARVGAYSFFIGLGMPLTNKNIRQLQRTIEALQGIVTNAGRPAANSKEHAATQPRTRRKGKDLEAFRKSLAAERKRGVPVAELAEQYGVTPSYIYQLPAAPQKARKATAASQKPTSTKAGRKKTPANGTAEVGASAKAAE